MAHDHAGHSHASHPSGHSHAGRANADRGRLAFALGLILTFMAVEVGVGVVAHSLALLSDAGHMLTDAAAIGFSLVANPPPARPARAPLRFGLRRLGKPSDQ